MLCLRSAATEAQPGDAHDPNRFFVPITAGPLITQPEPKVIVPVDGRFPVLNADQGGRVFEILFQDERIDNKAQMPQNAGKRRRITKPR